jgi:hypothetical protein
LAASAQVGRSASPHLGASSADLPVASVSNSFALLIAGATSELLSATSELWQTRVSTQAKAFEAEIDISNAAQQEQSPLFQLPAEIRTRILEFVFSDIDDLSTKFSREGLYFRPNQRDWRKSHTKALRTCKRVFQEARMMPVKQAQHTFWLNSGPRHLFPSSKGAEGQWRLWQLSLNATQKEAVGTVQLYTQAAKLHELNLEPGFHCSVATLTIREMSRSISSSCGFSPCADEFALCPWLVGRVTKQRMDGQPYDPDGPLIRRKMTMRTWGGQIAQLRDLEVLKIEFEVHESRKREFEEVELRASCWFFPVPGSNDALVRTGETTRWSWRGNADPKADPSTSLSTYLVTEMIWRRQRTEHIS